MASKRKALATTPSKNAAGTGKENNSTSRTPAGKENNLNLSTPILQSPTAASPNYPRTVRIAPAGKRKDKRYRSRVKYPTPSVETQDVGWCGLPGTKGTGLFPPLPTTTTATAATAATVQDDDVKAQDEGFEIELQEPGRAAQDETPFDELEQDGAAKEDPFDEAAPMEGIKDSMSAQVLRLQADYPPEEPSFEADVQRGHLSLASKTLLCRGIDLLVAENTANLKGSKATKIEKEANAQVVTLHRQCGARVKRMTIMKIPETRQRSGDHRNWKLKSHVARIRALMNALKITSTEDQLEVAQSLVDPMNALVLTEEQSRLM